MRKAKSKKAKLKSNTVTHVILSKLLRRETAEQKMWADLVEMDADPFEWDMSPNEALQIPTLKQAAAQKKSTAAVTSKVAKQPLPTKPKQTATRATKGKVKAVKGNVGTTQSKIPQPLDCHDASESGWEVSLPPQLVSFSNHELATIADDINNLEAGIKTISEARSGDSIQRKTEHSAPRQTFSYSGQALVVDDSPTIRKLLHKVLSGFGMEVRTASDGYDALKLLRHYKPNLIITDLDMPHMGGATFVNKINKDLQLNHIPVIVTTSNISEGLIDNLSAFGVADFLNKPFKVNEVHDVVSKFCSIPKPVSEKKKGKVIGIVSESASQRLALRNLLDSQGYRISVDSDCMNLDLNLQSNHADVNAWIVGDTPDDPFEVIDELEHCSGAPMLLGIENPADLPHRNPAKWEGNILSKLEQMLSPQH